MKKIIYILLASILALSLGACSGKSASPTEESVNTTVAEMVKEETVAETVKEETVAETVKEETVAETEPEKVVEFFEELSTLPTPDSCLDAKKTGSSTSSINGELTKSEYKYKGSSSDLISDYISVLKENGFEIEESTDDEVEFDVVSDKMVVAGLYNNSDGQLVVRIIPENKRAMSNGNAKTISLGQTISCKSGDFTLNNVEFTYELKPRNTNGVYTSYPAESGKVYLHVDGNYYNTSKRDTRIDELPSVEANYDNGYTYDGFTIVDDGDNSFDWGSIYVACKPLTDCHYHGLVELPEDFEEDNKPLFITIKMPDGALYRYDVR